MLLSIFDPQLMAINDLEHREEEEVAAANDEDTAAFDFHPNRRSQVSASLIRDYNGYQ